jgi:8-oxo-dGTP diphosphatase
MGKSSRPPILAAGGIVIRHDRKPLIAVVQRRRDGAWVLPKGKLKPNEKPIAAARREAIEETGCEVRVYEFLGVISYVGGGGPKIAQFWRMQAVGDATGKLMSDIKAVEWLPLSAAIERLSLAHEHMFLRNVGPMALKRALKKTRIKLPAQQPLQPVHEARTLDAALPVQEVDLLVPDDLGAAATVSTGRPDEVAAPSPSESQQRWGVLGRLKRWQTAMGRNGLSN